MTQQEIHNILKQSGALMEGHFILTSGLHSPGYIEKFRILEQPRYTEILCKEIADKFKVDNITVVVGPMTGGIILAYETGKQLGTKAIFTERVEDKKKFLRGTILTHKLLIKRAILPERIESRMKFRRGFTLLPTDRVLIVEDVITTGGSVQEVIDEVKKSGASIIGITCLVDRSNGKAKFDFPFKPLLVMDVVTYKPDECPMCKSGLVAVKPGSRTPS